MTFIEPEQTDRGGWFDAVITIRARVKRYGPNGQYAEAEIADGNGHGHSLRDLPTRWRQIDIRPVVEGPGPGYTVQFAKQGVFTITDTRTATATPIGSSWAVINDPDGTVTDTTRPEPVEAFLETVPAEEEQPSTPSTPSSAASTDTSGPTSETPASDAADPADLIAEVRKRAAKKTPAKKAAKKAVANKAAIAVHSRVPGNDTVGYQVTPEEAEAGIPPVYGMGEYKKHKATIDGDTEDCICPAGKDHGRLGGR